METKIKLSAKIYQCRDTVKKMFGEKYDAEISDYKRYIKGAMVKHKIDNELAAAIHLIDEVKDMDGAGVFAMKILAAVAEILEPSKKIK